jgi:hypothetical protein
LSAITAGLRGSSSGIGHLAHQVRAHVGALGEDAAAETREDRDQRRAEREADQRLHDVAHAPAVRAGARQVHEEARHRDEAESHHQQPGDRAALEGDVERGADAVARGFRRAHVGAYRNVHADVAGGARGDRADEEADRGVPAQARDEPDHQEDHRADHGDGRVLAVEVGLGAGLDGGRDLAHAVVAVGLAQDPHRREAPIYEGQGPANERQ